MNLKLLRKIKNGKFDLVFLAKADTVNYRLIPIFNRYSKTWFYFMDPLKIVIEMNADKYASKSTWSSATFSNISYFFKKKGANSHFITQGIDIEEYNDIKKELKKKIDVIFVGTKTKKRELKIEILKDNDINITCFGEGWENPPIYLEELIEKYKSSKIALNFTKGKIGFSLRVFQILGTKTFLLSEYCKDLEKLFEKGKHLDWFKDDKELIEKINYYLNNDEIREKISLEGYKKVKKEYTWDKIMNKIIKIVENDIKNDEK